MKPSTIYRAALQGAINLRRNRQMALAAFFITALSLIILGFALLSIYNLNFMGDTWARRVTIRVFLVDDLSPVQQAYLAERLKRLENVETATFISRDQALERLKKQFPDRPELFEIVTDNPLPDSFEVEVKEPAKIGAVAREISRLPGVEKADYGKRYVDPFIALTRTVWLITAVAALLLGAGTLFIITNAIRLTLYARRREIEIMKLVGATDWFIRLPFIFEGVIVGVGGAAVATLAVDQTYLAVYAKATQFLPFIPLLAREVAVPRVSLVLMLSGLGVGILGSLISIKRYLHV
ncbi:MAG: permease-like cell division protein FtsX [Bacillota bacterium]|nr:permease-like cell division protein FtsX [Bacillota bacterium]